MPLTAESVATLAQLACLIEAAAPKPGNVYPGRPFRDMRYDDFLLSALAIGPALAVAGERSLGATILAAVEATHRLTDANTNLGMVLLLAPLARAAVRGGHGLRDAVRVVLSETTVDDAVQVYAAVQRAHPGGMGTSPEQDLSHRPTLSLLEVMHLAAERDGVAREYATGFAVTFERGLPAIRAARERGGEWTDAAVECYLTILAATPDSLIARKCGRAVAEQVSERARQVLEAGNWTSDAGRRARELFDADLRDPQNSRNPGTTADLTAAALFVALIEAGGP